MKLLINLTCLLQLVSMIAAADAEHPETVLTQHREKSAKVADQQDELSADVQQLTIEQTVPQVIALLDEVGKIMDEATDMLTDSDTGGGTMAAQTEIIEKIHAAAKEKQKQQGSGQSGSAMMDMMERMMGKKPEGEEPGKGKDGKAGDEAGSGASGDSDAANGGIDGQASGKNEVRRIPKTSGSAGHVLPEEFRKALDAYNRGAAQKAK